MAASPTQAPQAPEFPYWPFNCLSLYTHMARDFGRYTQAMTRSTDPLEATRAEADFGVRLYADLMQGYFDLALAPWTAMASVMAQRPETPEPTPAAEIRPMKPAARAR
jgi:hypothetical protein